MKKYLIIRFAESEDVHENTPGRDSADFRQLSERDVELFKAGMEYGRQIETGRHQG
jgi:hypothetical protein